MGNVVLTKQSSGTVRKIKLTEDRAISSKESKRIASAKSEFHLKKIKLGSMALGDF